MDRQPSRHSRALLTRPVAATAAGGALFAALAVDGSGALAAALAAAMIGAVALAGGGPEPRPVPIPVNRRRTPRR